MPTSRMRSVSQWKGGALFEHLPPSGFRYVTDSRLEGSEQEQPRGPGPMELLLGALAGCTGIDVVEMLRKMRLELRSFRLEADAERRADPPRVFTRIHLLYDIDTEPADARKVLRAVSLSMQKYCSVSAILAASARIEYTVRHGGEEFHARAHAS